MNTKESCHSGTAVSVLSDERRSFRMGQLSVPRKRLCYPLPAPQCFGAGQQGKPPGRIWHLIKKIRSNDTYRSGPFFAADTCPDALHSRFMPSTGRLALEVYAVGAFLAPPCIKARVPRLDTFYVFDAARLNQTLAVV